MPLQFESPGSNSENGNFCKRPGGKQKKAWVGKGKVVLWFAINKSICWLHRSLGKLLKHLTFGEKTTSHLTVIGNIWKEQGEDWNGSLQLRTISIKGLTAGSISSFRENIPFISEGNSVANRSFHRKNDTGFVWKTSKPCLLLEKKGMVKWVSDSDGEFQYLLFQGRRLSKIWDKC